MLLYDFHPLLQCSLSSGSHSYLQKVRVNTPILSTQILLACWISMARAHELAFCSSLQTYSTESRNSNCRLKKFAFGEGWNMQLYILCSCLRRAECCSSETSMRAETRSCGPLMPQHCRTGQRMPWREREQKVCGTRSHTKEFLHRGKRGQNRTILHKCMLSSSFFIYIL